MIFDELNKLAWGCIILNEDTRRVIQEVHERTTTSQTFFFNLEALSKDAVGQNLIPDDIFVSVDVKVISTKRTTVKMGLLH